jgi:hypothetical protein
MPAQDTSKIKEKIISILKTRGPSLPVHIAKETGLSMLFSSAFLSELFSEKKIKISNMKVGSSPIYFIPEQKPLLENFSQYLKSKEKDAFILLKEKKILKDINQDPAIRVALREIKDFAIPFKKDEEIFWRYFIIPEKELVPQKLPEQELEKKEESKKIIEEKITEKENKIKEEKLDIFSKPLEKKKVAKKKVAKQKKQNEKLFNKVKEFLSQKDIEIIDIQEFSKDELILKIKENKREKLLIAYNKKRITELDLIKSYKKLNDKNIPYILLSFGEPSKKFTNLIESIKNLDKIEKISEITKI